MLVMALAVIFEPIRLGLAVLMLNRPRPMLQLLTFLCGGFTMGLGVGLVILFILRTTPLAGHFTVAQAQIVAGLLALLVAAALAANVLVRKQIRRVPARAAVGGEAGRRAAWTCWSRLRRAACGSCPRAPANSCRAIPCGSHG